MSSRIEHAIKATFSYGEMATGIDILKNPAGLRRSEILGEPKSKVKRLIESRAVLFIEKVFLPISMNYAQIAKKSPNRRGIGYTMYATAAFMGDLLADILLMLPTPLSLTKLGAQAGSPAIASGLYKLSEFVDHNSPRRSISN